MADQDFDFQEYEEQPVEPQGYGYSQQGYATAPVQATNTLAIISLVLGIVGFLICLCIPAFATIMGIPAIITGFIARNQIKQSGGAQKGQEMALAGLILGIVEVVAGILLLVLGVGMAGLSMIQEGL